MKYIHVTHVYSIDTNILYFFYIFFTIVREHYFWIIDFQVPFPLFKILFIPSPGSLFLTTWLNHFVLVILILCFYSCNCIDKKRVNCVYPARPEFASAFYVLSGIDTHLSEWLDKQHRLVRCSLDLHKTDSESRQRFLRSNARLQIWQALRYRPQMWQRPFRSRCATHFQNSVDFLRLLHHHHHQRHHHHPTSPLPQRCPSVGRRQPNQCLWSGATHHANTALWIP